MDECCVDIKRDSLIFGTVTVKGTMPVIENHKIEIVDIHIYVCGVG